MRGEANFIVRLGISILVVMGAAATTAGNIIYVDDSAVGANDGTSWTDAYNFLQDALVDANSVEKPVEIRVAQGIYTPDQGAGVTRGDSLVEFRLINGVSILGGFAGVGDIEPDTRYIEAFKTILSGDLAGDDVDVDNPYELSGHPTRAENSRIVILCRDNDETAVLDGVTITAGESGMRNRDSNLTVNNCTFLNSRYGIFNFRSSQKVTNCTFRGHYFQAIFQSEGSLILNNCLFSGNEGCIDSHSFNEITLHDCSFINNMITSGVIDCSLGKNLRIYNCIFKNNVGLSEAGVSVSVEGEFTAENCTFTGNVGMSIKYSNRGRLFVSNCLFAGNLEGSMSWSSSGIYSDSPDTIIRNCTFTGNSGGDFGSALKLGDGGWVSNCIFWDNDQPAIGRAVGNLFMKYCNVEGGWPGEGNIEIDPCFVMPGYWDQNGTPDDDSDDFWVDGDYHLCSRAGHWDQQSQKWVQDDVTSSCIDAGDPNSPIGTEPFPNGGCVNMGAYGSGDKASKSYFGEPVCDVIIAGDINGDCVVDFEDLMILMSHWMMRPEDLVNKPPTVRLLEPQDGDRVARPESMRLLAEANDSDGYVNKVVFYLEYRTDEYTRGRVFEDADGSDGWESEGIWPNNAEFGEWTIYAEAKDNEGLVSVSPEITVTLYHP